MDLAATTRNQDTYVINDVLIVHLVCVLNFDTNSTLSSSCALCSLLMNQMMEAGIRDIREITGMILIRMVITRNLKMANLAKEGTTGSYLHPRNWYSFMLSIL